LDAELDTRGLSLDAAVEIAVPEDVLADRMRRRAEVENRPDDRPDAFARRIQEYLAEAPGLRARYDGRLVVVDGEGTPDDVYERMLAALGDAGVTPADRSPGV
jgi:adenylate kinase